MEKPAGAKMLKVVGILLIVFAGLGVVGMLVASAASAVVGTLADKVSKAGVEVPKGAVGSLVFFNIVGWISVIAALVAGILGVAYCEKPEKAKTNFIMGIILVGIQVLMLIVAIASGTFGGMTVVNTLIGLVLPVLYIIGAKKNMDFAGNGPQNMGGGAY